MSVPAPVPPGRRLRWALLPLGLLLGIELGLAEAFLVPDYGLGEPAGLLLTVLANLALGWLVATAGGGRLAAAAAAVGWLVATLPLAVTRPEGDLVITGDSRGQALLLLGVLSVVVPVVWVPGQPSRRPPERPRPPA